MNTGYTSGWAVGITLLIVIGIPILFSSGLTRKSAHGSIAFKLPTELRVTKWMYLPVWLGGLLGIAICLVPLLIPNASYGDIAFFSAIGLPIALSGVMATITFYKAYIRLDNDELFCKYGRKLTNIKLDRIKSVYTSLGSIIVVTDDGNFVLHLFFRGSSELFMFLRRRAMLNQHNTIACCERSPS